MSTSAAGYPCRNRSYACATAPKLSARPDTPSILTRSAPSMLGLFGRPPVGRPPAEPPGGRCRLRASLRLAPKRVTRQRTAQTESALILHRDDLILRPITVAHELDLFNRLPY